MFTMFMNIMANLRRRPATRRYPTVKREYAAGARGRLVVNPDICNCCCVCEKRCPANAIKVTRDPRSWSVDPYRCILCGNCVDACNKNSLSMSPEPWEF